ncbi:uncharacterized protein LOC102804067, partial [Saccoglossus kowalevskii]|uniref:Hornerin-like n=1 Tax=Saccoglossus kowalevskii TaxID=10224 RepID=A0ABM0MTX9_SACKO
MASHREVRMEDQYTLFMSEIDKKERDEKKKLRGHGFEQSPGTSRKRNAQDGVKFGVPKKLQQQLGKQMLGIMMQTKNNPEQKPSSDQLKQVMLLMQQEFNQQWDKQKTELDTKETPPPPLPSASPPPPPPPPPPLPQSEKNRWRPPSPPYPPPSSSPLSNTHGRHSSLTSSAATSSSAGPSITQFKSLPLPPHELLKKKKQDPVKKSSSQVCSSKTLNQASYLSEKRKQLPVSHSISSSSQLSNETSKTQLKGEKRSHVPSLTLEQTNLYEFMKSQLKTGNESDHSHPMQSLTERDSLFARFKQSVPSQSASDMFIQRYKTPSNIGSLTHDDEIPKQHCEQDNKHTDEGKPSKKMIEQTMNLIECGLKSGNLTGAKAIQLKEVHKQLATHLGRLGGSSQHGDLKQKRDAGNFKSSESHFEKRTSPVILTTQQSEVQSSAQKYKLSSAPVEVPSGIGMMTSSHGHSGVGIMDSSSGKGRSSSGQGTHGMRSSLPGPVGIGTMGSSDQGTRGMRGSLPGPGGIGTMGSSGRQSNMKMMSSSSSRQDGVGMMGSSSGQGAHEMMGSSSGQGPHGMMGSSSGQGPQGMMGSSSGQGPHGMMGSSSGQGPHGMMGSSSGQGPHGMMGSSSGQGPHGMMGSSSGQGPHGMMSLSGSHGGGAIMSDILKALSSSQDGAEKMRMLQSMPNHPDRAKLLAVALALCGVKGPDIFATLKKVMPDEESRTSSQQPTSHAVQAYGVKGASSKGHVPSLMSISLPSSEHTIEPCGSGLIGIPTKSESGDTRIDNISGSRDKPQSHDRPRERSESRGRSDSRLVERVVSSRNKSGPGYCELCKVHCGEW